MIKQGQHTKQKRNIEIVFDTIKAQVDFDYVYKRNAQLTCE